MLHVLITGRQWRMLPQDFPPKSTAHDYFIEWCRGGALVRIHPAFCTTCRELTGKEASPTPTIVDSQSVNSAEKGARLILLALTRPRHSREGSGTRRSIRLAI